MKNKLIAILEETASGGVLSSSSNRLIIILTVGIVLLAGISIYLLVANQKMTKKMKAMEEETKE